jgi:hypothetical protein
MANQMVDPNYNSRDVDVDVEAELHSEDTGYAVKMADYMFFFIYDGCKWYWRVSFSSTTYGPFLTEEECVKSARTSEWWY